MHPTSPLPRRPIEQIELVPESVSRAYGEALGVYNAQQWNGTAVLLRRTLEGIVKNLLPADQRGGTLASCLEKLPQNINLAEPITTLSAAVREGGNLGAHFDDENSTDEAMAAEMLNLVEYLLEYLYVLPGAIDSLNKRLQS